MEWNLDMFPTTHWSLILDKEEKNRQKCLESLANFYWKPVYKVLRLSGYSEEDAKDYTQDLFLKILTNPEILDKANPETGRFRCYLLGILKNLQRDNWKKQHAQKRYPKTAILSLPVFVDRSDSMVEILDTKMLPSFFLEKWEEIFNQEWILALRAQTIQQIKEEYVKNSIDRNLALIAFQKHVFEKIKTKDISSEIGKDSHWIIEKIYRIKEKYTSYLKRNILDTVSKEEYMELEIRELMMYLSMI